MTLGVMCAGQSTASTIYAGSGASITAYDLDTNTQSSFSSGYDAVALAVSGDTLYAGSGASIISYDLLTGAQSSFSSGYDAVALAVSGDTLYAGSGASIISYNLLTGAQSSFSGFNAVALTVSGDTLYAGSGESIISYNLLTGGQSSFSGFDATAIAVLGDNTIVASNGAYLERFAQDGTDLGTYSLFSNIAGLAVASDGELYYGDGNKIYRYEGPSVAEFISGYDAVTLAVYTSAVPVPAASWLFGSGLIGLIGVARRKKA